MLCQDGHYQEMCHMYPILFSKIYLFYKQTYQTHHNEYSYQHPT
uniref:Uncharacterized protein n=1 Tax=virus sp. ctBM815 TaxID=2825806 RepID=A0A8S5RKU9_9VIRU|nr:MAG TPA: hypothetical protein [virus sp. ctBM815]